MTSQDLERPNLRVEGKNDKLVIEKLLTRHRIDYRHSPLPCGFPEIRTEGSVEQLLDGMSDNIRVSNGRSEGFVLDADAPLSSRWDAVAQRLRTAKVHDVPKAAKPTASRSVP